MDAEERVCKGCFMECEKGDGYHAFPCRDDVRRWAEEHRNDEGNKDGLVWEREQLLPCPFCGGGAKVMHMDYGDGYLPEVQTVWGVFCERDLDAEYAHGHCIENYATKQEAIAAWNRRAQ